MSDHILCPMHVGGAGIELFGRCCDLDLESTAAKWKPGGYVAGTISRRSVHWAARCSTPTLCSASRGWRSRAPATRRQRDLKRKTGSMDFAARLGHHAFLLPVATAASVLTRGDRYNSKVRTEAMMRGLRYIGLIGTFAFCVSASDQTWTGQISDNLCAGSHAQMISQRNKTLQTSSAEPDRDCTLMCIKQKGRYVFVTRGKVYDIANQNLAALQTNAGHIVRLSGEMKGRTITVLQITSLAEK